MIDNKDVLNSHDILYTTILDYGDLNEWFVSKGTLGTLYPNEVRVK